ncbi:MAG: DUF92 domain-containing protein [Thermofilaceae archaeon]
MTTQIALGLFLTVVAAFLAKKYKALSNGGIAAAVLLALTLLATSWEGFVLMFLFFSSSSVFTLIGYKKKKERGASEKEGGRNISQVLCSGAVPAAVSGLCYAVNGLRGAAALAVASTIAFSNADTWASELGSLSSATPRLVTNPYRKVPHGVSGGVTLLGELGAVMGSAFIAFPASLLLAFAKNYGWSWASVNIDPFNFGVAVLLLGWGGEVLDSILGALIQIKYVCPKCDTFSDNPIHICGFKAKPVSGLPFVKNETVNLISEMALALLALIISLHL